MYIEEIKKLTENVANNKELSILKRVQTLYYYLQLDLFTCGVTKKEFLKHCADTKKIIYEFIQICDKDYDEELILKLEGYYSCILSLEKEFPYA